MSRPASLGLLIATVLALGFGCPTQASAAPQREVPAQIAASPASPAGATATDSSSYAQREQRDQRDHKVANYQGGSTIVIGASGAALIVLLLVLVLVI